MDQGVQAEVTPRLPPSQIPSHPAPRALPTCTHTHSHQGSCHQALGIGVTASPFTGEAAEEGKGSQTWPGPPKNLCCPQDAAPLRWASGAWPCLAPASWLPALVSPLHPRGHADVPPRSTPSSVERLKDLPSPWHRAQPTQLCPGLSILCTPMPPEGTSGRCQHPSVDQATWKPPQAAGHSPMTQSPSEKADASAGDREVVGRRGAPQPGNQVTTVPGSCMARSSTTLQAAHATLTCSVPHRLPVAPPTGPETRGPVPIAQMKTLGLQQTADLEGTHQNQTPNPASIPW